MSRKDRARLRAADRAARSGSGPTQQEPSRLPGATGGFSLFGEVLLVGLLVSLAGILIVTLPLAVAAGIRQLRRYLRADDSRPVLFWHDLRRGLLPGLGVGVAALVLVLILLIDVDLARSGALPWGEVVGAVGVVLLVLLAAGLLAAASLWSPEDGWRSAIKATPSYLWRDPVGALLLAVAAGFVVLATWQLFPLVVPALGLACFAAVAVPERPSRQR
ncbi:hypothetical protein [Desertivibrio insolitus]|uniref:hypothetical protein n=1 Tax=Herbiconiux sp. SYSU D00978 TaxID=2812562 RepID=UPI001F60468E|nr:hypothetical protein [Herbiconiux sp. SYSU D00978]